MNHVKVNLIAVVMIVVISGGVGFYIGRQFRTQGTNSSSSRFPGSSQRTGGLENANRPTGNRIQGNGPISGEITSIDKNSITVKTQDGSSKIIIYSDQTKISKATDAAISDLKTGIQITTMGSTSTDGTVTAQNISIGSGLMQRMSGQPPPNQTEPSPAK